MGLLVFLKGYSEFTLISYLSEYAGKDEYLTHPDYDASPGRQRALLSTSFEFVKRT
jgi:hypothetical protein